MVFERYTKRTDGMVLLTDAIDGKHEVNALVDVLLERLADYEDTGLTPEGVKDLQSRAKAAELSVGASLHHVVDLVQAERSGRLLILPCKVGATVYVLQDDEVFEATIWNIESYEDGTEKQVPYFGIAGDLSATGETVVTVDYSTKTATVTVTVSSGSSEPDEPETQYYSITNNLTNAISNNSATSVAHGESYTATITVNDGYTLDGATVLVTVGGEDVTATAYSSGVVNIENVTGDICIDIVAASSGNYLDITWIPNRYLQSGHIYTPEQHSSANGHSATDYISPNGYAKVVFTVLNGQMGPYICFYTADKTYISGWCEMVGGSHGVNKTVEIPENASYFVLCAQTSQTNTVKVSLE